MKDFFKKFLKQSSEQKEDLQTLSKKVSDLESLIRKQTNNPSNELQKLNLELINIDLRNKIGINQYNDASTEVLKLEQLRKLLVSVNISEDGLETFKERQDLENSFSERERVEIKKQIFVLLRNF